MASYAIVQNNALVSIGIVADRRQGNALVPVVPAGAVQLTAWEYDQIKTEGPHAQEVIAGVIIAARGQGV